MVISSRNLHAVIDWGTTRFPLRFGASIGSAPFFNAPIGPAGYTVPPSRGSVNKAIVRSRGNVQLTVAVSTTLLVRSRDSGRNRGDRR